MKVSRDGRRVYYFPSRAAMEIISEWDDGAIVAEWEVDDCTGQPTSIHFSPSLDDSGWRITQHNGGRPFFSISTSEVGIALGDHSQVAEETEISRNVISVRLLFEFRPR
jgi:hypothetical protein